MASALQLFTVKPPPAGQDHHAGRPGSQRSRPGESRSARGRRRVSEEAFGAARNRAPALPGALQHGPASPHSAGRVLGLDQRALTTRRVRETRPAAAGFLFASPQKPGEEEGCAKRILATLMRRAYRRPVTDADLQVPLQFYQRGARRRADLRRASRWPCAPCW